MRRVRITIVFIVWLFFLASLQGTYAQIDYPPEDNSWSRPRTSRLDINNGLSQNAINSIVQDSEGFLWFGTQDGLNKFDAYDFTVFKHDPRDLNSIDNSEISIIFEDSRDLLWIGTVRGLNKFDKKTARFTRYKPVGEKPVSPRDNKVTAIAEDTEGNLWIGTEQSGLFHWDRKTENFTAYPSDQNDPSKLTNNAIKSIWQDSGGVLWVGIDGNGLHAFDTKTGKSEIYRLRNDDDDCLSSNHITSILGDAQGRLWIGTKGGGLVSLIQNTDSSTFEAYRYRDDDSFSLSNDNINGISRGSDGMLWIATDDGLNQFDLKTKRFRRFHLSSDNQDSPAHEEILSIFVDTQGLVWVGTRFGIHTLDPNSSSFEHCHTKSKTPRGLSSNIITSLFEDSKGNLWVGTYGGGLNKRSADNLSEFVHYTHRSSDPHSLADIQDLPIDEKTTEIATNVIFAIFEDSQKALWIGTGAGLHKMVPGEAPDSPPIFKRFQYDKNDPSSLSNNLVHSISEDFQRNLWIGTMGGGLNKLELGSEGRFIRYRHDRNDPRSISDNRVRTLLTDSQGDLWIGTSSGLDKLVLGADAQFIHFPLRYGQNQSLPGIQDAIAISCMAEDDQGDLWIGTKGSGLHKFHRQTGLFTTYTEKDGLSNNTIHGLMIDGQGKLWLSTNRGINKFDPVSLDFIYYGIEDGIQALEFTEGAFFKDRHGNMYFGGLNGFNVFQPDLFTKNMFVPPVVLTGFFLFNKPVPIQESGILNQDINQTQRIVLDYKNHNFSFKYSSLNNRNPHRNRFAYRLEGIDEDWIYTGADDRQAVYTHISPGTYTFHIRASNDDGVWNETGRAVKVIILAPWWQTLWFKGIMATLIIGFAYIGYRRRVSNIQNQKHQLEMQVSERTSELQKSLQQLEIEIEERQRIEQALQRSHEELESRVEERTAELNKANVSMKEEIIKRKNAEKTIKHRIDELETLHLLGTKISTSLLLEEVADAALKGIAGICEADLTMLFQKQGEELELLKTYPENPEFERTQLHKHRAGECLCGLAMKDGKTFFSRNIHHDPRSTRQECKAAGLRSVIALPLFAGADIQGVLAIASIEEKDYSEQITFLEAHASLIGLGMRNAILHQGVQRRLEELSALYQISQRLQPLQTLDTLVQKITGILVNSIGYESGGILLTDESTGRLIPVAFGKKGKKPKLCKGKTPHFISENFPADQGLITWVEKHGQSARSGNARQDARCCSLRKNTCSVLCVPIIDDNRIIGVISVESSESYAFDESDQHLIETIASYMAIAIRNDRLFEEIKTSRERVQHLAKKVISVQEQERQRLSRELHDEAAQALTALRINIQLMERSLPADMNQFKERLSEAADIANATLEQLRDLSRNLRHPALEGMSLESALEALCQSFSQITEVSVHYNGRKIPNLSSDASLALYRFLQEALTNVAKHADAHQVQVVLSREKETVCLSVIDDGKGFDPEAVTSTSHQQSGLGLQNMRERLELLGGHLKIESSPIKGARLVASIPLAKNR